MGRGSPNLTLIQLTTPEQLYRGNSIKNPSIQNGCFKVLRDDTAGKAYQYKARLCARGFKQTPGLDYTETFSPVVRYDSLMILLAVVAEKDQNSYNSMYERHSCTANCKKKYIWRFQRDFILKKEKKQDVVCNLNKTLYGLKQASRCWNKKFRKFLEQFNFRATEADKCMFRGCVKGTDVFLALFVDDGLIAAKSHQALDSIIKSLTNAF